MRIAILLLLLSTPAHAENPDGFAWQQHPGAQIPLQATLHDEAGRSIELASLLGHAPAMLDLGYFHCPSLCGITRADLFAALRAGGMAPGQDVAVISVSIDPAETPADATTAKAADLAQAPAAWRAGVHYVTAAAPDLAAIERAAGFRADWDPRFKQFMHPAGIVLLTRTGLISTYLLGVGYTPGDMRAAILRAGDGGIAQAALPILLLCFHFDSTTGRYTLAVEKLLRLLGGLTVVTIAGLLFMLGTTRPEKFIIVALQALRLRRAR